MSASRERVALNAIQWINLKADPDDPASEDLWLYADPAFRADYPRVLGQVRAAGFEAVMMEVLNTQTLQDYGRMIQHASLRVAPGYCSVRLPSDYRQTLVRGTAEWVRWFDPIRRKAEETNYFGLGSIFLAPEVRWGAGALRTEAQAAVGAGFDEHRLDEVIDVLGEAATVLAAEGVRAGLHNHVGTWVETEHEIDRVLGSVDPPLLGASFDVGHLAWAGMDPAAMLRRHSGRLLDLHLKDLDLMVAAESRHHPTSYRSTVDKGLFLEPGRGQVDLPAVIDALAEDFEGWIIIEVDRVAIDPLESAILSRAWVDQALPASS